MPLQFEINTNGQAWDKNSLLAVFAELLIDFKRYATNETDWVEAKQILENGFNYLKTQHNINIIIRDDNPATTTHR